MPLLTSQKITNLYLYGKETAPENLLDESLIRSSDAIATTSVDTQTFMTTGPGRFAVGRQFDLVNRFFTADSTQLPVGSYSKSELAERLGYDILKDFFGWNMNHYNYQDGTDDYAERTYIWNSQSFKIVDDASFIVEENGSRHIESFGIEPNIDPRFPENFDFKSQDGLTKIGNDYLQPRVDPSNIGRKVNIDFTGEAPRTTYDGNSYLNDLIKMNTWSGLDLIKLKGDMDLLLEGLWFNGVTRFLDSNNRPILYGTDNADNLYTSDVSSVLASTKYPYLKPYAANGIVLIGGKNMDTYVSSANYLKSEIIIDDNGKLIFDGREIKGTAVEDANNSGTYILRIDGNPDSFIMKRFGNDLRIAVNDFRETPASSLILNDYFIGNEDGEEKFGISLNSKVIPGEDLNPFTIAGLSSGKFIVLYSDDNNGKQFGQVYDSSGAKNGNLIPLSSTSRGGADSVIPSKINGFLLLYSNGTAQTFTTSGPTSNIFEIYGSATGLADGNYASSWSYDDKVFGKIFNAQGIYKNSLDLPEAGGAYPASSIAGLPNGNIAMSWGGFGQIFNSDGSMHLKIDPDMGYVERFTWKAGNTFHITGLANNDIRMLWQGYGTDFYMQTFNAGGFEESGEDIINIPRVNPVQIPNYKGFFFPYTISGSDGNLLYGSFNGKKPVLLETIPYDVNYLVAPLSHNRVVISLNKPLPRRLESEDSILPKSRRMQSSYNFIKIQGDGYGRTFLPSENFINGTNADEILYAPQNGGTVITGGGADTIVSLRNPNTLVTIPDFDPTIQQIDLTSQKGVISSMDDFTITPGSAVVNLPNNQTIHLDNTAGTISPANLTAANFIFALANQAPIAIYAISAQMQVGGQVVLNATNSIIDPDADTLTWRLNFPKGNESDYSWLSQDPYTAVIRGTVPDAKSYTGNATATDPYGLSAFVLFNITGVPLVVFVNGSITAEPSFASSMSPSQALTFGPTSVQTSGLTANNTMNASLADTGSPSAALIFSPSSRPSIGDFPSGIPSFVEEISDNPSSLPTNQQTNSRSPSLALTFNPTSLQSAWATANLTGNSSALTWDPSSMPTFGLTANNTMNASHAGSRSPSQELTWQPTSSQSPWSTAAFTANYSNNGSALTWDPSSMPTFGVTGNGSQIITPGNFSHSNHTNGSNSSDNLIENPYLWIGVGGVILIALVAAGAYAFRKEFNRMFCGAANSNAPAQDIEMAANDDSLNRSREHNKDIPAIEGRKSDKTSVQHVIPENSKNKDVDMEEGQSVRGFKSGSTNPYSIVATREAQGVQL